MTLCRVGRKNLNSINQSVCVTCDRGFVLVWPQCSALCTSGFVDDVTFWHNGPNTNTGSDDANDSLWLAGWRR